MGIEFEWDEKKAVANARKHRVTFDEAETVFADENSIDVYDPDHSADEDRFVKLGMSHRQRVLIVVYTERSTRIRIISTRKANAYERKQYEERR